MIFHANKLPQYQYNFHVKLLTLKIKKLMTKVTKFEKEILKNFDTKEKEYSWVTEMKLKHNAVWFFVIKNFKKLKQNVNIRFLVDLHTVGYNFLFLKSSLNYHSNEGM